MTLYDKLTDQELACKIKQGEKKAFHELYCRYAPRVYKFAMSYLKNKGDSDEIVQNTFLKIWEKKERLNDKQNIKSFIFKVGVNIIYDFIRKKNIEKAYSDYLRLNFTLDENYTWHSVVYEEMQQNLQCLLSQMPEQQRKVFYLSKFEGLTNEEIARKLDLSKRTVENHLYRSITFLKKRILEKSIVPLSCVT